MSSLDWGEFGYLLGKGIRNVATKPIDLARKYSVPTYVTYTEPRLTEEDKRYGANMPAVVITSTSRNPASTMLEAGTDLYKRKKDITIHTPNYRIPVYWPITTDIFYLNPHIERK